MGHNVEFGKAVTLLLGRGENKRNPFTLDEFVNFSAVLAIFEMFENLVVVAKQDRWLGLWDCRHYCGNNH